MSTSGNFRGSPAYVRPVPDINTVADTGPHAVGSVDLTGIPAGAYRMVLTFTSFGFAYDSWFRFSPSVEIYCGGGDNPGPFPHTFTQDVTVSGPSLPLFAESTGGDDMTYSNITFTFTLIGGRA